MQKVNNERRRNVLWKRIVFFALILIVVLLAGFGGHALTASRAASLSGPGTSGGPGITFVNGHLVYQKDSLGNQIPDFSSAGYGGGKLPLPTAPVKQTLSPQASGDDTARIQQAINSVSGLTPDANGIRGAVLLNAGTYRIAGTIRIATSGVVLRGSGEGTNGTILVAQGALHTVIVVAGRGTWTPVGGQHNVSDAYVPIGATSLHVDSTVGLAVGDHVIVQSPQTASWIHAMGMDKIPPRPDGHPMHQWSPNPGSLFDRTITAISGNQITLDAPLTSALEKQYAQATVWKYTFPGRISQVGVEDLSSDGTAFTKVPGYASGGFFSAVFASMNVVENGWMQHITINNYGQGFLIGNGGGTTKQVTVTQTTELNMSLMNPDPPAGYSITGQQILVEHCRASGQDFHVWTTQAEGPGPNVFTQCTATGPKIDAAPHQRWSTGTLFDDLTITGTGSHFAIENRLYMGSGQGWSAGNSVLWNCMASDYHAQSPPTGYNWAIGCQGINNAPAFPNSGSPGVVTSPGKAVSPASLYAEQLAERP